MNSRIVDIANNMEKFLNNLDCHEDAEKIRQANAELRTAISKLKDLPWDQLFAIEDEKRQELTICQQNFAECFVKLKRILLESFKECFESIKKL